MDHLRDGASDRPLCHGHLGDQLLSLLDLVIPLSYGRVGYRQRAKHFEAEDPARDLHDRVIFVTGASAGLGLEAARALAARGAEVHLLCRDEKRGRAAMNLIEQAHPSARLHLAIVDLARLDSIRRFLAETSLERFDVLIHNAGVLPTTRTLTETGLELSWATNVVGPFALTRGLAARLGGARRGRVITVSSGGMYLQRLDLSDLDFSRREYDGVVAYANTKRAEVILNELWAAQMPKVDFFAMHPGWADTDGVRQSLPRFHRLMRPFFRSAAEGADTIVWLASSDSVTGQSGTFWFDRAPVPTHLFEKTRESDADRHALRALLDAQCSDLNR